MLRALSSRVMSTRLAARRDEKSSRANERHWEIATASKKGRLHENEDRVVTIRSLGAKESGETSENTRGGLNLNEIRYLAVFDGHCGSECASFMAENLHEHITMLAKLSHCETFQDLKFIIADAFKSADDEFSSRDPDNKSGSCGVIALMLGMEILVAHVGDSRAILHCNNKTTRLTRDHRANDQDEVKRVLSMGGRIINGRVGGVMAPSRSFGDNDVRREWGDGIIISEPDISYATLEVDGEVRMQSTMSASSGSPAQCTPAVFLMLASDGIFDDMSSEEACRIIEGSLMRSPGEPRKAAEKLAKLASSKTADDCTVVLAVWTSDEPATPTRVMSKRFDILDAEDASSPPPSPLSSNYRGLKD